MKLFQLAGIVRLAAAALTLAGPVMAQVDDYRKIQKPALAPFQPQQPQRLVLENGMVIFLQEDHELPLINGFALVRGGSREEPATKTGLVSILGEVWRTGGTRAKTGDQLDDFLEARGARVETGGNEDSTRISWSCLKADFDDVFGVFLEVLQQPEFREDKIVLAKTAENTAVSRRNDSFTEISFRESAKLAYGADNPYVRQTEYATIAAVTREDLLNWHKVYTHPNNMILGVVGDFDSAAIEMKLRQGLGHWSKGKPAEPARVEFRDPKAGIYFIEKNDVNQSAISMVHLGSRRDNPDYYAIEVMNQVFGGSFAARLFSNVRSKKGLAYAVFGEVGSEFDHPGVFQVWMTTKSGTTAQSIDALYRELDDITGQKPPSAEELQRAKESIENSFVFRFDTKQKVLRERINYEFHGYPADFLERYLAGVQRVTIEEVAAAAKSYIHREKLAILVVGKAADFDRPLSTFGPLTAIDITIPKPEEKAKP